MNLLKNHSLLFFCFICLYSFSIRAGNNPVTYYPLTPLTHSFVAGGDIFGTRVFVENKGQFDSKLKNGEKIYYAYDNGDEHIYFTGKGVVYELRKSFLISERQKEAIEEGKTVEQKPDEVYLVTMNWHGANTGSIVIEPDIKQSHYITYGEAKYNSSTYKKITYKNVYTNIDVEYSIPEDKGYGVKYCFILHPGANAMDIKMLYAGDLDKVKQNKAGEILIKTPLGDIVEHVPSSFTSDSIIVNSEFSLHGDTLGFVFPEGYDTNKTLIIDPWVTSISSLTNNNYGFDVDYDFGGNTFIYGGTTPFKIAFYNSLGVLIWTFSGTVVTPAFTTGVGYISNFAVDKFTSKSFTGQGFVIGGAQVIRINALGNYDNFISTQNGNYREIWEFGFHCLTADVYILGGGTNSNLCAATINTVTSSLNVTTFNPTNLSAGQDIVCNTIDDQGNIFVVFAGAVGVSNKLCRVNAAFNNNLWLQPTGYTTLSEGANKAVYAGSSVGSSNGFNCLAVNGNYLYFYDGSNLAAYNKTTGTVVASTTVPGLIVKRQGGIAVDDCDNLYLGGVGNIITYHFNGTSFATLTPIALATTVTTQYVFDIKLNKNTKMLYVSGSGFVGTYQAAISNTCATALGMCLFNQGGVGASSTSITCATLGSATVTANGGTGPFTYTWIPSGQTGSVAVGLSPGIYTVIVYDTGYNVTYTTTVFFTSLIPLGATLNYSGILNCNGAGNGTANISGISGGSGSQSYLWTDGLTTQTTSAISGLSAGNYSVTVTDGLTGCIFTQSFVISQPLAMNLFMSVSSPTACVGDSITVAGMNTGGSPPYTYTWTAGPPTSTYQVTHALGGSYTYSLNSTDNVGCPISSIATITFVPRPVLSVSNVSICPFAVGAFTALGASSYTWLASTTLSNQGTTFTASPLANTQYTLIGTALGCTSVAYPNMILKPVPSVSFSSNSPICNGQNLQLNATGGASYVWTGPLSFTSPASNPLLVGASPAASGVYQFAATAPNSCTAATSGTVTVNLTPTLSVLGSTVCSTQILSLTASSFTGATFVWSGPLNFNSLQQNPFIYSPLVQASGNYTVKATSVQGCTNTAIANVTVTGMPAAGIISNSPRCFGETLNLSGTGGIFYSWSGPNGFSSTNQNPQINNVTVPAAGVYTLVITTGPCVASTTKTITVYALPQPTATNNGPLCQTKTLILHASNGGVAYSWSGPNFTNFNQHPAPLDSVKLVNAGVYTVVVTDNHGCVNLTTTTVSVMQNPTITALGATVCLNDTAVLRAQGASTYLWYGPNNYYYNRANAIIKSATSVAPTIYTVVGTAVNTCSDITTVKLATIPLPIPSLTAKPKTRLCLQETLILEGFGGLSYDWTSPGSLLYSGKTVSVNLISMGYAGDYSLTVWDINACHSTTTIAIQMDDLPGGSLGGVMQGCVPFKSDFNFYSTLNTSSVKTSWQLDGRVFASKTFSYNFVKAGDYPIIGQYLDTLTNCRNTASFVVNAYALPVADYTFSPEKPVESVDDVIFTNTSKGENQKQWSWFFMDNNPIKSNKEQMTYLFRDEGIYPVVMIVKNGWGCTDTVVKAIKVEADFSVYVPNAFTPNGDGINEVFMPVLRGVKFYHLSIFDRWGAELFESAEISNGWDGTFNSANCKQDVYVWKIKISANNGQQKELTGHVSLYR